jgi:hypothetical protein
MFIEGGDEIALGIRAFAGLINVNSTTRLIDARGVGAAALAGGLIAYRALGVSLRKVPHAQGWRGYARRLWREGHFVAPICSSRRLERSKPLPINGRCAK